MEIWVHEIKTPITSAHLLIYFLTLMLSVSLFYAFNSITMPPAFSELGATKKLLANQMGIFISALSVVIAIVLGFLIIYANQFLLKRRTKELGIYMTLGMRKGKISRIFVGETMVTGIAALVAGLFLGIGFFQGLSLISLKLFAVDLSSFRMLFSLEALQKTILCFAVIFVLVMFCNVWIVSRVKLIDLLSAVLLKLVQSNKKIYLKGLNVFLLQQIGGKIQTNFLSMLIVCVLLMLTICTVSTGISIAITMNQNAEKAIPYDLVVYTTVERTGDVDIVEDLKTKGYDLKPYIEKEIQFTLFVSDYTYGDLFEGQDVQLWDLDNDILDSEYLLFP